jgi:hypothetical protein
VFVEHRTEFIDDDFGLCIILGREKSIAQSSNIVISFERHIIHLWAIAFGRLLADADL